MVVTLADNNSQSPSNFVNPMCQNPKPCCYVFQDWDQIRRQMTYTRNEKTSRAGIGPNTNRCRSIRKTVHNKNFVDINFLYKMLDERRPNSHDQDLMSSRCINLIFTNFQLQYQFCVFSPQTSWQQQISFAALLSSINFMDLQGFAMCSQQYLG